MTLNLQSRVGLGLLLLTALLLSAVQPAQAVELAKNYKWNGGYNNYVNRGTSINIEVQSPAITSNGSSAAYNLTCDKDNEYHYMQIGWVKQAGYSGTKNFWEWSVSLTNWDQAYFGSPPIGSVHEYKITSDSTYYYLMIDNYSYSHPSKATLGWSPDHIQFMGEVNDTPVHCAGTPSNHCSFTTGGYKDVNGNWWKTYYYSDKDLSYFQNTAGNSSSSFDIWDTRD